MPFDGNGNFSPQTPEYPAVTGTTIQAADWNAIVLDLADGLSNTLTRDGQSPPSADVPMGGKKLTNLADGTLAGDAATFGQLQALLAALLPAGSMVDYAGTAAPSGYLLCDGSAVNRTTYAGLFAAIGTTWGAGNGTTTFNVPDFRRRVAVGSGGSGTGTLGNAVGNTGGAETHTLLTAEMPTHKHVLTDPTHGHSASDSGHQHVAGGSQGGGGTGAISQSGGTTIFTGVGFASITVFGAPTGISMADTGGSGAHNNMQPSAVVTKIIKT